MSARHSSADAPVRYHIRVRGVIESRWSEWFDGMSITYDDDGNTLLVGRLPDQAALYGVLHRIRDLGLVLLGVGRLPEQGA